MPIFKIFRYPHPVLRKKCKKVENVGAWEKKILAQMVETMYAFEGVGLAASQVGIERQMIVIAPEGNPEKELIKLVNPSITLKEGESLMEEGCLSLPEITLKVKRAGRVIVEGIDEEEKPVRIEAENLFAHILQHEIDHLQGKLIIDYVNEKEKKKIAPRLTQMEQDFENSRSISERKKDNIIAR